MEFKHVNMRNLTTAQLLELEQLDQEIHDLNLAQARVNGQYDRAADGSPDKQAALNRMHVLGEQLRKKWARVNELVD